MSLQGKTETFLTTEEAAEFIGVAVDTVRTYIYRGKISSKKFGHQIAIAKSECERYIKENPGPGKPAKKS